jgi:hypothetical protein
MSLLLNHCDDGTCEACGAKLLVYANRLTTGGRKWLARLGFAPDEVDKFGAIMPGRKAEDVVDEVKGKDWHPDPRTKATRLICTAG